MFSPYMTDLPENYAVCLQAGTEYLIEKDGERIPLKLSWNAGEWSVYQGSFDLEIGENKQTYSDYDDSISMRPGESTPSHATAWYVHHNGQDYLWVQYEERTAIGFWAQLHAYAIGEDSCRHLGMTQDVFGTDPLDPEHLRLERYFDIMRHGDSMDTCSVTDAVCNNGMPDKGTSVYEVEDEYGLVVATDLNMKDAESGETVTIPEGLVLFRSETDAETYVILSAPEHGIKVRVKLQNGEPEKIDGKDWWDVFEPGWATW